MPYIHKKAEKYIIRLLFGIALIVSLIFLKNQALKARIIEKLNEIGSPFYSLDLFLYIGLIIGIVLSAYLILPF